MSTCCWCTPGGLSTLDFLKQYAARACPREFQTADEDLCYCLECVAEYHKARDGLPLLHEVLWELETLRLINHFEKSMKGEMGEEEEVYIVDSNREAQLFDFTGQDFENKLRVPLLEILKYPYLLLHERVNELCVEALCRMEQANCSFQVFDKHPGIYLFLVHPNEMVRRWAILTARNLGKVDRDDYYDLQEVLTCLFKVIELGLLESPDIYTSSVLEKGKLILLPSHMYDTTNYKNYWLGICMLLTILEEQAMDSLLLGSEKQNDFMQSILHTMEREADDDSGDPFWPALHCFMVILDRLGSKVWGQLIDPIEAFQTIINNASYNREIRNIRNSSVRPKFETESCLDDVVTCSQIVYNFNPEKTKKDSGWRAAICPDYCPNMYEEMETLTSVLQSDIGQDMRVHNSTFLWFIPFVQSLMELKDLGVAYIVEVIHHLHSEVKDVLNQTDVVCDKVTEFFLLILVSVIELHRNKKCLHLLWVSSQQWVEAVVKCAKLPTTAFVRTSDKSAGNCSRGTSVVSSLSLHAVPSNSVQLACVQLIRSLLKEGYHLGQQTLCKRFWDKLNLFLRGNLSLGWQLTSQETHELQTCLKQIIRNIKFKVPQYSAYVDLSPECKSPPASCKKEKSDQVGKKSKKHMHRLENSSPTFPKQPVKTDSCQMPESVLAKANSTVVDGDKQNYVKDSKQDRLSAESSVKQSGRNLLAEGAQDPVRGSTRRQKSVKENSLHTAKTSVSRGGSERGCDRGVTVSPRPLANPGGHSSEKMSTSNENFSFKDEALGATAKAKTKTQKDELCAKLSHVIRKPHRKSPLVSNAGNVEDTVTRSSTKCFRSKREAGGQRGDGSERSLALDASGLLDSDHGEQKPQSGSVLKTLLKKELDLFPYRESSGPVQDCRVGEKDPGSFTEGTGTFVKKTAPCEDPLAVPESREGGGDQHAGPISSDLSASSKSDTLTDSQVDRDLHKLSLIAQASVIKFPSDSTQKSLSPLPRREARSCSLTRRDPVARACSGPVIVISDSDEDDDDVKMLDLGNHVRPDKMCVQKEGREQLAPAPGLSAAGAVKEEEDKPGVQFEESDSQFFEFESENEVFSVWQDQRLDDKHSAREDEKDSSLTRLAAVASDRGYDTGYASEEAMKTAESVKEPVEAQSTSVSVAWFPKAEVKKPKRKQSGKPVAKEPVGSSSATSEDQPDVLNEPALPESDSASKKAAAPSAGAEKASAASLKKASPKRRAGSRHTRASSGSRGKKAHLETKRGQSKNAAYLSCRVAPAVVPPKKSRQCPEPASTVEKLGLKKAPRRAFDLSQQSLESLAQLRDHGKNVGVIDTRRKAKLISPQAHSVRDKKLLTSQDLQLQRQARPKPPQQSRPPSEEESARPHAAPSCDASASSRSDVSGGAVAGAAGQGQPPAQCVSAGPEPVSASSASEGTDGAAAAKQREPAALGGSLPAGEVAHSASEAPGDGGGRPARPEVTAPKEPGPEADSDMEDESLFLTQNDPMDMDLCSQMEPEDRGVGPAHGRAAVPAPGEASPGRPVLEAPSSLACRHRDCGEPAGTPGDLCARHAEAKAADEDVFRKPGLPLSAAKPLRPSTTKVFSSSGASRTANLSRSLESAAALLSALKSKPSGAQSAPKAPQPAAGSPTSLGDAMNLGAGRPLHKLPFADSMSFLPASGSSLLPPPSICDTFVREVLKWKYDMFVAFDQRGPPASLCQSISRSVPVRFQDYREYLGIFFPLVVVNTFETVAQEWISSPNKEKFYQLHLRKFPADYKRTWEFVVYLEECELAKQLHPKENDLIFLVPERREKSDVERNAGPELREHYCGYIHKFRRTSVMRNGKSECSLSIQTQDNLPVSLNELVRCVVISSLVTTQRKLKAMSLLGGRSQLARVILNPDRTDFCTADLLTQPCERIVTYLRDFNEDQKKAIETAYAMVKHTPRAKVCLIHGPPGTGKSKTIVGLLYRLLTESQRRGHSDENFNAKIKQNRVLVCAPSNAAVDELMKKIILEFKERCKDKKNPLGNCGDINLVRLGPEKSINSEVLRFSLDSQVNHRMKKDLPSHVQEMHRRKEYLDHQLDELSRQRALCRGGREMQRQELDEKIARVSKERQELASRIKEVQGRPQKTQSIIILESHIICCTLSTSGGLLLESAFRGQGGVPFSCVIVDEASQSSEVETLTPLIHRCNKLVLVGDPKQLPPTVISLKAQEYGYDQSMMARFCKLLEEGVEHDVITRLPILQLTVQYRMHPDICLFPSNYVYNRSLKTNRVTETNRCSSDWPFQPYLVFDVGDGSERRDSDSYVNVQEIKLVMELVKLIKEKRRDVSFRNIGIITHYKAQKTMIQRDLDREFDRKGLAEVDTVDAFQGRQKDCIIVTCVRANTLQGSIGFLASLQRLNVTITRAKYSLFILGHLRTLMENQHWNQLIQDAQRRGAIVKTCDRNYRQDVAKILKRKPVLQRGLTHPPTGAPEAARPQGGLPGSRPDSGLGAWPFASSLCHSSSDLRECAVPAREAERSPAQDQLRDPRLLRRMGLAPDVHLRDPPPRSPPHPGAMPPLGEPGGPQDLGAAARGAAPSTHQPCEARAASPEASSSKRKCGPDGALGDGRPDAPGPAGLHPGWGSAWDPRWPEEDGSSKKRKLLP